MGNAQHGAGLNDTGGPARKNGTRMTAPTAIMSRKSKIEYLESGRARCPSRNRAGRSAMVDEVINTLGWDRKHAIKALNGKASLGRGGEIALPKKRAGKTMGKGLRLKTAQVLIDIRPSRDLGPFFFPPLRV